MEFISNMWSKIKNEVSGNPVPTTETNIVSPSPPLTQGAGRRRVKKTRKGGKRRTTRKNVNRR